MKKNKKFLIMKIVLIILGSVVGAGFATGQELYSFFGVYGKYGRLGIICASLVIAYIIYIVLKCVKENNIKNYEEYMMFIFRNNKFLSYLNKNIILFFLLLSFLIMELGFASLLYQQYNISKYIGILFISILSYIVFMGKSRWLERVNIILMPILIITIMYVSINGVVKFGVKEAGITNISLGNSIISSIIYASYNLIMLIPLLISIEEKDINKRQIKSISLITFLSIIVLSSLILIMLNLFDVSNVEIPVIYIANYIGNTEVVLSVVLVLVAIFTSVICIGFSFLNNITKNSKSYNRGAIFICSIGTFMVNFSFANTIRIFYSFLGFLGIIQIFAIILANFREN